MNLQHEMMPEGVVNFRDISTLPRRYGYPVRSALFYRADNLGRLTERGLQQLAERGVRAILDLRRPAESQRYPSRPHPQSDIVHQHFDLVGEAPGLLSHGNTLSGRSLEERNRDGSFCYPVERLAAIYSYILDRRSREICRVFLALTDSARQPAVFHCVAGQDRTGIVAALLLSAASVPESVIAEDYALTAEHNLRQYLAFDLPEKTGLPIYDVESYRHQLCPPQAMLETLDHLRQRYGDAQSYLEESGVPQERTRALVEQLTAAEVTVAPGSARAT